MKLAFNPRYLILGLLVYVVFLVLSIPADRVYNYWKSSEHANRGFALAGISGSVWSGHADVAVMQGNRFESVEWTFRPWSLLVGEVGLNWRFQSPDSEKTHEKVFGHGVTSLGLGGSINFSSLEAQIPVSMMASLAKMKALQPSGSLSLNLQEVDWDGESLVNATGKIVWRQAGVNLLQQISFGDLTLNLDTRNDEINGLLADSGGPLSVEGLITLKEDGNYQFNGVFASRGDKGLENALRSLGPVGPNGKVKINYSGNLAKLGF